MGAVAVEDGFEQSSSGDYSGRTHGRSSKISGKNPIFSMPFGSPHPTKNQSADAHMHPRIFYFPPFYKAFRLFPFPPVSVRFRKYPRFYGTSFGIRK